MSEPSPGDVAALFAPAVSAPSVSGETPIGEGRGAALNTAIRRRIMGLWRFMPLAVAVGLGVLWGVAVAEIATRNLGDATFFASLVVFVVAEVVGLVVANRQLGRIVIGRWRERGLPASQVVSFTVEPERLVIAGASTTTAVRWAYVSEIAPTRTHWLMAAGGQVFFIPRRFFPDREAEAAFLAAMLARMPQSARARSPEAGKLTTFV